MKVEIYNPVRNIRIAPRKSFTDPMDALRELTVAMPEREQRVEIQCDAEFFQKTGLDEQGFDGVPIVVEE